MTATPLLQQRGDDMKEAAPKNRLRELRDRSRLTLQEVSTLTGFSVATISRHEGRSRGLSEDAVLKYSSLYKVHSYEIFVDPREAAKDASDD